MDFGIEEINSQYLIWALTTWVTDISFFVFNLLEKDLNKNKKKLNKGRRFILDSW